MKKILIALFWLSCLAMKQALAGDTPDVVWKVFSTDSYQKALATNTTVYGLDGSFNNFPGTVQSWNVGSNQVNQVHYPPELSNSSNSNIVLSPDGQLLAIWSVIGPPASSRTLLRVIDTTTQELVYEFTSPLGIFYGSAALAFSSDNQKIAIASYYSYRIGVINLKQGRVAWFRDLGSPTLAVTFVPESDYVITAGDRLTLHNPLGNAVWSWRLPSRADNVNVLLGKDGNYVVAAHKDRENVVRFYDLMYGTPLQTLELPGRATLFTFAHDRQKAVFRSDEQYSPIVLFSLTDYREVTRFDRVFGSYPTSIAISPDETRIYISDGYASITSYLLPTGERERVYGGQATILTNEFLCLNSGELITIAGNGGWFRWDPANGDVWPGYFPPRRAVSIDGSISADWYFNSVVLYQGLFGPFLREIKFEKNEEPVDVKLSPNGRLAFVKYWVDGLYPYFNTYDSLTGKEIDVPFSPFDSNEPIHSGQFARGGGHAFTYLFSGGYDSFYVQRTSDWKSVASFILNPILPNHYPLSWKPSPDGSRLLLYTSRPGPAYQLVCLMVSDTPRVLWQIPFARQEDLAGYEWKPDSSGVVLGGATLNVVDANGKLLEHYPIRTGNVGTAADGLHYGFYSIEREYLIGENRYQIAALNWARFRS